MNEVIEQLRELSMKSSIESSKYSLPSVSSNLINKSENIYSINETNMQYSSTVFEYLLWQKVLFSFFIFVIIFFSIIGNVLVIVAIVKYPYLRITNNIFLASLAIADLAVAFFAMTLNALQILSGHWYLKSFMCRFWLAADILFSTASILHLFCVSFDRYLSISDEYSFYYTAEHPTKCWRVRGMISSAWIISALISFVPIFTDLFTTEEYSKKINSLDYLNGNCELVTNMPYRISSSFISFWIPALGMIFFYTLVMHKANKIEKNKLKMYNSINPQSYSNLAKKERNSASSNSALQIRLSRDSAGRNSGEIVWKRKFKALKTLGTVITVFCLCWIFFFLEYTFCNNEHINICPEKISNNPVLKDILFWIGYFNSMINPWLYNFTNHDFRKAFRDLLKFNKRKKFNLAERSSKFNESRNGSRVQNPN